MFSLETLYRQNGASRDESIRRAEHARLVKLVLDARRLLRSTPTKSEILDKN